MEDEEKMTDSDKKWQSAFNAISDAVCLLDMKGEIEQCNTAMADLLGKPSGEVIGKTCCELFHDTPGPVEECPLMRMTQSRRRETLELPRGDRWFKVVVDPIVNESNELIGAVHAIKDITERKRVEETLKANQNFLQTIIETEPECVKLIARDGTLLMMNRAGLAMIEADSFEQIKGQTIYPLVPPEYRKAFEELTDEVFEGKTGTLEFEMVGIRGRRIWLATRPFRSATRKMR